MKLISGLFRFARKRLQTVDNDMGAFREKIMELVEKKDSLTPEEVSAKVTELQSLTDDLPESDDKSKLLRFLQDFNAVKEQDSATAQEAAKMTADLFEKCDTAAMQEVSATETPKTQDALVNANVNANGNNVSAANAGANNGVGAKDGIIGTALGTLAGNALSKPKDEAPNAGENANENAGADNAKYTLEELYQFIKKRMNEDCTAKDEAPDEKDDEKSEEKKEEEKENEGTANDSAPRIPISLSSSAAAGSLADMFNKVKNGGR